MCSQPAIFRDDETGLSDTIVNDGMKWVCESPDSCVIAIPNGKAE